MRYDKSTKASFLEAASQARAAGKSWTQVFRAAAKKGYTGTRGGMEQMIRKQERNAKGPTTRGRLTRRGSGIGGASELMTIRAIIDGLAQKKAIQILEKAIGEIKNTI